MQVPHSLYSARAPGPPDFRPAFGEHLLTLSDHLENTQTREAEYLAEMLALRDGTHVLTHVGAGAALVQDQVRREVLASQAGERSNVPRAASAVLFHAVSAGVAAPGARAKPAPPDLRAERGGRQGRSHSIVRFQPASPCRSASAAGWRPSAGRACPCPRCWMEPEAPPELPVPLPPPPCAPRFHRDDAPPPPGCLHPRANGDAGACDGGRGAHFSFGGVFQEGEAVSGQDAGASAGPLASRTRSLATPLARPSTRPAPCTAS